MRRVKSILGHLPICSKQAQILGLAKGRQISPYLELCCLRVSANVSYANAQADVAMLTGMEVRAKTQQRLVQRYDFPEPTVDSTINQACVDGGKVRLRTPLGEPSVWRDYKALDTDAGVLASFQNNSVLIDWLHAHPLAHPRNLSGRWP